MKYKLNPDIAGQVKVSYAKEETQAAHIEPKIDCSAGSNPFLMPVAAMEEIKKIQISHVNHYPHFFGLKEAIIDYFKPVLPLKTTNILLTSGSIDAIYQTNYIFMAKGAKVLGISPQFSDYVSHVKMLGMDYIPVPLKKENNYKLDKNEILEKLDHSFSLIYIDNPHNPTGQVIPKEDLRQIAYKAKDCGACLIVDEAYGEFMDEDQSCVGLLKELDNVLIFRTFSKGWGLAGLRAGYVISNEYFIQLMDNISNPYVISEPARRIAAAAMSDRNFLPNCRKSIASCKEKLLAVLGENLSIAYTTNTVPIVMITHKDENCDLAALLLQKGVEVVSGEDFMNIGKNSIRLRLPVPEQFEELLSILKEIDNPK